MVAALYRRYRPESFAEMIGQRQVTDPLATAIRSGRINHAYLFSGPRGCGKTTSARILARCLNCAQGPTPEPCGECDSCRELGRDGGGSLDVLEIDAASHGGVEDARELRERAVMAPSRDRYRIFIIDEAHMVTGAGFNALLKVVEEPPEDVLFIFATTEPEKVIGTIRSRTHHYPFRLIPPAPMLEYVEQICREEHVTAQPGVLPLVVRAGGGSARDTMSLLDQLIAGTDGNEIQYDRATQLLGFTAQQLLDDTVLAFAEGDADGAYRAIDAVIQSGQDPRRFVEDLLERVRDLIVAKAVGDGTEAVLRGRSQDELERLIDTAARFSGVALSGIADAANTTLTEMTGVTAPKLQLELMVARILVSLKSAFAGGVSDAGGHADADGAVGAGGRPGANAAEAATHAAQPDSFAQPAAPARPAASKPAAAAATAAAAASPETAPASGGRDVGGSKATPASPDAVSIGQIRDAWPSVLERVLADGGRAAWAVVNQLQPLEYAGDVLRVDVPNHAVSQQLRHSQNGRPPAGQLLKTALQHTFNVAMRVQPRVRRDGEPHAGAPADDDRHRAPREPLSAPQAQGAQQRQQPAHPSKRAPEPVSNTGNPGVSWTVATIPGEPQPADDGPGSAWDEYASGPEPYSEGSGVQAQTAAPAAEEIAAREASDLEAATTPQPVELPAQAATTSESAPTDSSVGDQPREQLAAGEDVPAPAGTQPAADAQGMSATTTKPDAAAETEPDASGWNVAALPDDQPEPQPEPEPEEEPEPEPVRRHPALVSGAQRYGESVVRERLGARFVGEEPIVAAAAGADDMVPPDDVEAPPEEY